MAMSGMFKYLLLGALFIELAAAANYTVGGPSGGWDAVTDEQTWASSQSFHVGDNLIFQYSTSHDVTEVTKADYDSCQASNPIQTYTGGSSVVPLSSPGKRYFICSTVGHCSAGMKLAVNTLASSLAAPAESPAESPIAPSPVAPPPVVPEISPIPSPAPETSLASPSESPVPEITLPTPSESPLPGTSLPVPEVPDSEDPTNSTPMTRTTSPDSPTSSASKGRFPVGFGKGLSFVAVMLMAL
ncbi:uclacyanin 1-like [Punica granatum]|uniref:Phytocyanin domain-containing protein n=2 Tax=Punica granatum TaxID=22663 RepID=A0A218X2L0_PUNGR|nr:uclacyanin 1-like [Punica granatum]OWM78582.1 hypothetical protein CDL15_Pgr002749 [Punica granatum]PKI68618.1 hypothetical protein CRG98_011022 [Punica granatum]